MTVKTREDLEQAARRAEFLAEASRALAESLDTRATLGRVLELAVPLVADWGVAYALRDGMGLDRISIYHGDPRKARLLAELEERYPDGPRAKGSPLERALSHGEASIHQPVRLEDMAKAARDGRHIEIFQELGVASALVVPLVSRGRVLGALSLVRATEGRPYLEADLRLVEELGLRAGAALDNAALFRAEAEARERAEGALERLTILQSVTSALAAAPTPEAVSEIILDPMRRSVGAAASLIFLRQGPNLVLVHASGLTPEAADRWRLIPADADLPLAVTVRAGEPLFFASADELLARFPRASGARLTARAWAVLPLTTKGETYGGVVLAFAQPRAFSPEDRAFLATLAEQGGQALARARLDEELRRKEERFELASAAVDEGLWEWDVAQDNAWRSPRTESMFGYDAGELGSDDEAWAERIYPDDRARTAKELEALLASKETRSSTQYRFRRKDGTYAFVLDRCAVVRDEAGAPVRLVGSMLDISRLKELEEAALVQKALLESQNEAALDGIFFQDVNGRAAFYNRRLLEMWGVPAEVPKLERLEDRLAKSLDYLADPQSFYDAVMRMEKDPDGTLREDLRLKDGRVFDCYSAPVRAGDGRYCGRVWFYRDVTQRRLVEESLVEARRQLARSEKLAALGTLVSGVAHEIRTPLAYVSNHSHLITMWVAGPRAATLPELDRERLRDATGSIAEGVERINRLVQDLRRFMRLDAPGEEGVVDEAAAGAARLFEATHRGQVQLLLDLRAPATARLDRVQLQQILLNLIGNAAEASPRGARIWLTTRLDGQEAEIVVRDEGSGIPPDVLPHIWEPFFTTKREGTGLGLSIVRRIIEASAGAVACESAPGEGTRVVVRLPLAAPASKR